MLHPHAGIVAAIIVAVPPSLLLLHMIVVPPLLLPQLVVFFFLCHWLLTLVEEAELTLLRRGRTRMYSFGRLRT